MMDDLASGGGKWRLRLKAERLDISKTRLHTGRVKIRKETVVDERSLTVPVVREELVIEREIPEAPGTATIRIPLSQERIEIVKHPVKLADVTIRRRQYQTLERVEETLREEKLHLETEGAPKITPSNPD